MPRSLYQFAKLTSGEATLIIKKFNPKYELVETYHMNFVNSGNTIEPICSCFAGGSYKPCRHKKMLKIFQTADKIGKPWLYDYDKGLWIDQTPIEEP